jgi:class 3 adenylate cyclase
VAGPRDGSGARAVRSLCPTDTGLYLGATGARIIHRAVIFELLGMAWRHADRPATGTAAARGARDLGAIRALGVAAALWRIGRAMVDLPDGTVTFLFTDVEGSTRLLARLGDGYAPLLATHQRVLRSAFGANGGCEVGTQGDAFFVAFSRAREALVAAVAAQRGLASVSWPAGVEVRVRMGLHTGEAALRGAQYVGLDVHRAARICAAGHGGQVLVSGATRELVANAIPPGVALRDLGRYALRDIARPEHLFEVVADDVAADFPSLRRAAAPELAVACAW